MALRGAAVRAARRCTRFGGLPAYELQQRPDFARLGSVVGSRDGLGGVSLSSLGAVLTVAYAALVLGNPLAGRIADRGRTRTLVVVALGLLTLVYLGIEMTRVNVVAIPLAFVALCLTGTPMLAGNVLLSCAATHASLDQTVSQTLATLAWAPAAIVGSVTAGAVSSPDIALFVLAVITACAATDRVTLSLRAAPRSRAASSGR